MINGPVKLHPAESVDTLLRVLQERNENGEVFSATVAFFDKEGYIQLHWANISSMTRAVGALERLKHELFRTE